MAVKYKKQSYPSKLTAAEEKKIYYSRLIYGLTWNPYPLNEKEKAYIPQRPDWSYCHPVDKADGENKTLISVYPDDYPVENPDLCCRIFAGDVRFFDEHEYGIIRDAARIEDFPMLNLSSFYHTQDTQIPIIPPGTYIEILRTETHLRKDRNTEKNYWYIMCMVKVSENEEYNPDRVVNQVEMDNKRTAIPIIRGQIGYVWYVFMCNENWSSVFNIGYVNKPGVGDQKPFTRNRIIQDYHDYSIPFPKNINIKFSALNLDRCRANCLNKVKKTYTTLFESLVKAAENSSVKEIRISSLDYGSGYSHPDGRACDIVQIVTTDNGVHDYFKQYKKNKKTDEWEWTQPVQPAEIFAFEQAYLDHSIDPDTGQPKNPYSDLIWGPWYMYESNGDKYINLINDNSKMGTLDIPDKINYIYKKIQNESDEVRKNKKLLDEKKKKFEEEYVVEFGVKPINDGIVTKSHDKDGKDITVPKDDLKWGKKVIDHFQHRHHGHYQVKE